MTELLRGPEFGAAYAVEERASIKYKVHHDFDLAKAEGYRQQYGDLYFLRLARLKPTVERIASSAWHDLKVGLCLFATAFCIEQRDLQEREIGDETVRKVERVLDVRQGEFCWVVGTVYMDMPMKPNILEDIAKDQWIAAPSRLQKYTADSDQNQIMLEDESGRLRLIGHALDNEPLVTGCIVAALGTEKENGDFEVVDIKIPDLASHPPSVTERERTANSKVAFVSGLQLSGSQTSALRLDLLTEYLLGESTPKTASISRLVIAGNSLAKANPLLTHEEQLQPAATKNSNAARKHGYDGAGFNPHPGTQLDSFLNELLPSLPVTLLPGDTDPANVSLPQQPLHAAIFPMSRVWADPPSTDSSAAPTADPLGRPKPPSTTAHPFHPATNPALIELDGHMTLVTAGQPTRDISKYLDDFRFPSGSIDLLEATMRWRLIAPTAPDTLWCYPYQTGDPFVVGDQSCPKLYVVGNCERFDTRLVSKLDGSRETNVRCICLPDFHETGELVLVDMATLVPEVVRFELPSSNASDGQTTSNGDTQEDAEMED